MRDLFPGHYDLRNKTDEDFFEKALIIFDTNVLFDFFRFSEENANSILDLIEEKVHERIWIPYQVAYEYHRGITKEVTPNTSEYDALIKALKELHKKFSEITSALRDKSRHPYVSDPKTLDEIRELQDKLIKQLSNQKRNLHKSQHKNKIKEKIADLFTSKVGKQFTSSELEELYQVGKKRYIQNIPPGFADIDKPEPLRYGDWIVWKSILIKLEEISSGVIFVTGDNKMDWFVKINEKETIPHPELINEVNRIKNIPFDIYTTDKFIEYLSNLPGKKAEPKLIKEAKEIVNEKDQKSSLWGEIVKGVTAQSRFPDLPKLNYADLPKLNYSDFTKDLSLTHLENVKLALESYWNPNFFEELKKIQTEQVLKVMDFLKNYEKSIYNSSPIKSASPPDDNKELEE